MTFLNAILLGGVLAGAIPVIIHIINRNRFKRIQWGAMHLIEQILRRRRRRLKIEQIILLLVRIAIPVLLALCMARPVITEIELLKEEAKTSLVVLLDNSYSMNAFSSVGSHFDEAKTQINTLVNALPRGSMGTVAWMSGRTSSQLGPTYDKARLRGMLAANKRGFGTADSAAGIETAAGIYSSTPLSDRELVIMSDFQRVTWSSETAEARQRSLELLRNIPIPPRVTLFRVGKEVTENIAVESIEVSRPIIGVAQNLRVRGTIKNYGKSVFEDMRIHFRVDGKNRSASQMTLGAGESGQVVFSHSFETPGSHVVEIFADADLLKADNVKRFSIPVWDRLPVLLVSGDTNPAPLQAETAFLQIALQPFASAEATLSDLMTTRIITPQVLTANELMQHRVVVLANVPKLTDEQVKALDDFVRRGGGLLVFPGDRIDRDWYNSKMLASGAGLLPCRFLEVVASDASDGQPGNIVAQHYEHQALEFFNDPRNGTLQGAKIRTWYKLAAAQSSLQNTVIAAHLDSSDPFLVEKQFGQGRVIQCCTACDDDWSNLPARPAYLPLMQQLVSYLASTVYPPRNVGVGEQLAALLVPENAEKTAFLTDPEGRRHELKAVLKGDHCLVEFSSTELPGLYALETPDNETIHFVVNTSSKESDLALLNDTEFAELAQQMYAEAVSSSEEYLQLDKRRRFGQELWKKLLAVVLTLILIEILLQQRFGMVKK